MYLDSVRFKSIQKGPPTARADQVNACEAQLDLELPAISNHNLDFLFGLWVSWLTVLRPVPCDLIHDVHAFNNSAENDVLPVKPRRLHCAQEKLRSICVWSPIHHGQNARPYVLQSEVFVSEDFTVD